MSYTKHYFAGSQRVSSKIGTTTNLGVFLQDWTLQENTSGGSPINLVGSSQAQLIKAEAGANKVYTAFRMSYTTPHGNPAFVPVAAFTNTGLETEQYYFHPDHLGSSNYITNIAGEVSQHTEYFAFGETFVEEHKGSNNSPYKFNGKELDNESGLYYYGARYYDPRISIWASVDPLANVDYIMNNEAYVNGEHNGGIYNHFNHNSYSYCYQNPIKFVDPNGKQGVPGMIAGFLAEVLVAVGTKMFENKVNPGKAISMLTWQDGWNIAVGTGLGAAGGIVELANKARNPVVRKVLAFLLETSLEVLENLLKESFEVYSGGKEKLDIRSAIYGAVAEVGMGDLLSKIGIKHKAFEKAKEKAQRNARAAEEKVADLSRRRSPNAKKIAKAQERANKAIKEAKAFEKIDNLGRGLNGAVEEATGNKASDLNPKKYDK
jgi:RHS repeat-associated protein